MGNCSESSSIEVEAPKMAHQLPPTSSATPPQNGQKFDTIIVGGGIAGVASAVELSRAGQRVAIFESNGYLGGRLKTTPVSLQGGGTLQFDEGASWIHGSAKQNPITALSQSVPGLAMKETVDDSLEVFDEKGEDVQKEAQQAFAVYEELLQKCSKLDSKLTMREGFANEGENVLEDKYFMYNVANDIEFQTSGSIDKLAATTADDDEFEGPEMLILSGYQRFVDALARKSSFPIYLNQKITKIAWDGTQSKLTSGGISVYCDKVIIAVPIGVLKAKGIEFSPNFPNWKTDSINSIGFGNVCKILLDFPNADFWDSESQYIGVVSEDVAKRGLGTYFLNLKAIAGIPALMTFGLGDNADEAQKMPEQQLKNLLAKRVSAFSKEEVTSESFRLYRTSWRSQQSFKGTYAYASTSTEQKHWQNMAKPIFEFGWYFCGEHTTSKYRGTVHGAYLSGVFAAKCIQDGVEQQNWIYPDFEQGKSEQKSQKKSENQ